MDIVASIGFPGSVPMGLVECTNWRRMGNLLNFCHPDDPLDLP